MNLLMAKIELCLTTSLRFESEYNVYLNDLKSQFPRLSFMITLIAPIINNLDIKKVRIRTRYSKMLVDRFIRYYYPFHNQTNYIQPLQFELPLYADVMQLIYKNYGDRYDEKSYNINMIRDLSEMCYDSDYFMIECDDFNVEKDLHIS